MGELYIVDKAVDLDYEQTTILCDLLGLRPDDINQISFTVSPIDDTGTTGSKVSFSARGGSRNELPDNATAFDWLNED